MKTAFRFEITDKLNSFRTATLRYVKYCEEKLSVTVSDKQKIVKLVYIFLAAKNFYTAVKQTMPKLKRLNNF